MVDSQYACPLIKPPRWRIPTLLLSSNHNRNGFEIVITARLVIERLRQGQATGEALAGALFAGVLVAAP